MPNKKNYKKNLDKQKIDDDGTQYVLIFNKNIKRKKNKSENVKENTNTKQIIAMIAQKNIEYNDYSISYIVLLSVNDSGQTNIFVTTTDGIIHYAGNLKIIKLIFPLDHF